MIAEAFEEPLIAAAVRGEPFGPGQRKACALERPS